MSPKTKVIGGAAFNFGCILAGGGHRTAAEQQPSGEYLLLPWAYLCLFLRGDR